MDDIQTAGHAGVPWHERRTRRALLACLLLFVGGGWLLRAALAVRWPTIARPDEIYQALEPAHRLWTGWGAVTWEWRDGIRSWLFPDFLFAIMRASSLLHLPARAAVPLIWLLLSGVAAGVIAVGVLLGWRRFGLGGAVLCGMLCAMWPDLVYYGPKTLTEVQAGNLLAIAAGLASVSAWRGRLWVMAGIGALLALSFDLRFQLAPALGLVAIWAARGDVRRGWVPLVLGAAIPIAALGVVDFVTWGSPFQSIWKNVEVNFLRNKADFYGVEPPWWYLTEIARKEGAAMLPLAIFFVLGFGAAPLLGLTALVVIGFHSVISHKEISFIYAAVPPAIITVGLGTAWVVQRLPSMLRGPVSRTGLLWASVAGWFAVASLTGFAERPYVQGGFPASLQSLWADLRGADDLCGFAFYGRTGDFPWVWSEGYTGLNKAVPMYLLRSPEALKQGEPGANYVIATAEDSYDLPGYRRVRCSWSFCLLRRPGPCSFVPEQEISQVLARMGS